MMDIRRRVFVSVPVDDHLTPQKRDLKAQILKRVRALGFEPQIFLFSGMPAGMAWSFAAVNEVMRRCQGALILAFTRWSFNSEGDELNFPTEYNHYEGALANAHGLPILTIAEKGVIDRGIVWTGGGNPILFMPPDAGADWLEGESFRHRFQVWTEQLSERRDVFLGYCSQSKSTADAIHLFMSDKLKLRVHDWAMDFTGGGTILDEIHRAAKICTCGVFLFTRDDPLEGDSGHAAPRDNVVFEAGYFISAKGKDRVLIIREEGAKMPADIGGSIYLHLADRTKTSTIESALRDFLEQRL
jgi:hypothetical protein